VSCVERRRRKNRARLKTGRQNSAAVSDDDIGHDEIDHQDDDGYDHNHVSVVVVIIASLLRGL